MSGRSPPGRAEAGQHGEAGQRPEPAARTSGAQPPRDERADEALLHASAVALDGRALLITGESGSGKSGLALILLALGARLVADDGALLTRRGGQLWVAAPPAIRGLIEARGLGILAAHAPARAQVVAELDLSRPPAPRLPPPATVCRLGVMLPMLAPGDGLPFAAGLIQYLRGGRAR